MIILNVFLNKTFKNVFNKYDKLINEKNNYDENIYNLKLIRNKN